MDLESVCDFVHSLQRLPDEMRWKRSFFIMQFKSHLLHLCAQLHFPCASHIFAWSLCLCSSNIASIARTQNKWIICKVTDGGSTCPTGAQCFRTIEGTALWPMAVIGDGSECIERSANRQFFQNNTMRMLHIIFLSAFRCRSSTLPISLIYIYMRFCIQIRFEREVCKKQWTAAMSLCNNIHATLRRNQNSILEIPTARCELVSDKLTMFRFAWRLTAMRIIKSKTRETEVSYDERKHSIWTTRKLRVIKTESRWARWLIKLLQFC